MAFTNARVVTQSSAGTLTNATVLVNNDVIAAVGRDVKIPAGTRVIDATGLTITPGLIDVRSTLWLTARSAAQSSTSGSMNPVNGIDPYSEDWLEVAAQGVTAVYVQPTGTFGGPGHVLQVAPSSSNTVADLIIQENAGIQASLGLTARSSSDRYKQYTSLKSALTSVKKYQDEWKKYEEALKKYEEAKKKKAAGDKGKSTTKKTEEKKPEEKSKPATPPATIRGRDGTVRRLPPGVKVVVGPDGRRRIVRTSTPESKDEEKKPAADSKDSKKTSSSSKTTELKEPKKPKRDPIKDILVKVLKKETPLRIELHRADDATNALKLADEMKIDVVFDGVSQLNGAWDSVREKMTPLVVGPFLDLESAPTYLRTRRSNWSDHVNESQNRIALGTFSKNSRGSRFLRASAAAAVAQGMDRDRAMAAITKNAAQTLGLKDKMGSLAKGMRADLAVFSGDPLDPATAVRMTVSAGKIVHDNPDATVQHATIFSEPSFLPEQFPGEYAIKSQQVLFPDGSLKPATIKIGAGRIVAVGDEEYDDLPVYDLGDAVVSPGLVAGHVSLMSPDTRLADTAWISAADSFDPDSQKLRSLIKHGFTSLSLAPASSSVLAGQIGCVRIRAKQDVSNHAVGSLFVLANDARTTSRFPATLSGQVQLVDGFLNGEQFSNDLYIPTGIQAVLQGQRKKLLGEITSGEIIAQFHAETAAEIRAALNMIARHKLQANLVQASDIKTFLNQIKELHVGIIARPMTISDYDWYAADLARASNEGVRISFGNGTPEQIRITASMAVNAGMQPAAALRALTSDAAAMCGLKESGKIAADAPADLVIWNGSPLDLRAKPLRIIVDGQTVGDQS